MFCCMLANILYRKEFLFNIKIMLLGSSIYYWGVFDFHDTETNGEKVKKIVHDNVNKL